VVIEPAPLPESRVAGTPGFLQGRTGLIVGSVALFGAMAGGLLLLTTGRTLQVRGLPSAGAARSHAAEGASELRTNISEAAERIVRKRDKSGSLNTALDRAGLDLRPGEYVVLVATAAIVVTLILGMLTNLVFGVVLGLTVAFLARLDLRRRINVRRDGFADQLPDVLMLMAGSLRAGLGLTQALQTVESEAAEPASAEIQRVLIETRLGRNTIEALQAAAERVDNPDFRWVVEAIAIQREIGGDLAEVLDNVASTIRDRNELKGKVKALSAEGRWSGIILFCLPFVVAAGMSVINPRYLETLTNSTTAIVLALAAGALMILGGFWMKKIIEFEY
jgi:tight adherence protein B